MIKNDVYFCNWCLRKILVNKDFYSFKNTKDFHVNCFYTALKEFKKQEELEIECDKK